MAPPSSFLNKKKKILFFLSLSSSPFWRAKRERKRRVLNLAMRSGAVVVSIALGRERRSSVSFRFAREKGSSSSRERRFLFNIRRRRRRPTKIHFQFTTNEVRTGTDGKLSLLLSTAILLCQGKFLLLVFFLHSLFHLIRLCIYCCCGGNSSCVVHSSDCVRDRRGIVDVVKKEEGRTESRGFSAQAYILSYRPYVSSVMARFS